MARVQPPITAELTCAASDGVEVRATVTGDGPPLILLAGGIDYLGRGWQSAVDHLADRRRVVRFVRRFYRPELGDPFRWGMRDEARDVAALATALGGGVELLGHSSGAVLALECLVADPELYRAAVVFEAPINDPAATGGEALVRARRQLDAGRRVRAMVTFHSDVVGMPSAASWLGSLLLAAVPDYRRRIPGQLADLAAIDALGDSRPAYGAITQPVLGVYGTTSPAHLPRRMRALLDVLPNGRPCQVEGGHAAQASDPEGFVRRILAFLDERGPD